MILWNMCTYVLALQCHVKFIGKIVIAANSMPPGNQTWEIDQKRFFSAPLYELTLWSCAIKRLQCGQHSCFMKEKRISLLWMLMRISEMFTYAEINAAMETRTTFEIIFKLRLFQLRPFQRIITFKASPFKRCKCANAHIYFNYGNDEGGSKE